MLQREPDVGEGLASGSVGADLALRPTEPEARGACLPLRSLTKAWCLGPRQSWEFTSLSHTRRFSLCSVVPGFEEGLSDLGDEKLPFPPASKHVFLILCSI